MIVQADLGGAKTIDAAVNNILKAGIPEILVDRAGTAHDVVIRSLPQVDQEALRGVFDRSFGEQLNPDYYKDKQNALFFLDLNGAGYKGGGVVMPFGFCYLDVFGTDPPYQGNGTAKATMRKILGAAESLSWRSWEGRPINDRFYKPLIDQLNKMGIPAEVTVLPRQIHGRTYLHYGINLNPAQHRESMYLAQDKPRNFG